MSLLRRIRNVAWGTVQQWRRGPPPPVEEPDPADPVEEPDRTRRRPPVEDPPAPDAPDPVREPEPTPKKRRL
jgi:hypothetical protein